jgi:hypothetical protein
MNEPATFLLLTFKHEPFVRDAVRGALAQDYQPLDILISDDASPDRTFDIVSEEVRAYRGPHRVRLNRNERRLGSVEHLVEIMAMVETGFVVMAHGDDVSLPQRTRAVVTAWRERKVTMVSSNARRINARGTEYELTCGAAAPRLVLAEEIVKKGWFYEMLGAVLAFEPDVLRKFEPLTKQTLAAGLDHVLPLRAAAMRGFYYLAEPLVLYRWHEGNMSNATADRTKTKLVFDDTYQAYEMLARVRALDDIAALEAAAPGDAALARLREQVVTRLLDDLRLWSRVRAELRAADMRPTWLSEKEMARETLLRRVRRWLRPPLMERIRNRLRGALGAGRDVKAS